MAPIFSVITSVYNKEGTISDCIDSILNQDYQDFEMIVVDDGSTDSSAEKIAGFLGDSRIRTIQTNHLGHSRAKNRGAKEATGQIFYFIDADSVAGKNCLSQLKMVFDKSDVSCVGGELRALNEDHLIPRAIDIWHNPPPQPPGGNVAYKRDAFEKAGGFDERIEFGEDVDLYWRVRKLGFKYCIDQAVGVRTIHPQTVFDLLKQRFRWGMGYGQVAETHPEIVVKELQTSFRLFTLTILSSFLILVDLRLVIIFLALDSAILLRYVHFGRLLARDRGKADYWPVLAFIKLLDALAYYFGYYYWKFLKFVRRSEGNGG